MIVEVLCSGISVLFISENYAFEKFMGEEDPNWGLCKHKGWEIRRFAPGTVMNYSHL